MSKNIIPGLFVSMMVLVTACAELQDDIVAPLPERVTYVEHIQPLLERSCVRCHNDSVTNFSINLSTYEYFDSRVTPGESNQKFLTKIVSADGKMYQYLNDPRDYDLFYQWIVVDSLAEY